MEKLPLLLIWKVVNQHKYNVYTADIIAYDVCEGKYWFININTDRWSSNIDEVIQGYLNYWCCFVSKNEHCLKPIICKLNLVLIFIFIREQMTVISNYE